MKADSLFVLSRLLGDFKVLSIKQIITGFSVLPQALAKESRSKVWPEY